MKDILISNNKLNKNIFLFGLHNCGNLTSNTLKIFLQNSYFKSIAIIGCCLHLLKEYISPETKISKDFNDFYKSIGYDKNNKFLDNSLLYELNDDIGYPLSDYIRNKYKHIFFGKDIRNADMINNIENAPFDSISTKKNFFRALLQKFLEENLEEYGNIYGLGKNKYIDNCSFLEYVKDFLIQLKTREKNEKILEKIENLIKNSENICTKFFEENKFLLGKHYALNLIRIKFAKIVEYIVSLDRVIFLLEKGINNVNLIRIFNNHISPRNLLIYASKD
jgi:cyclophilin family peptidyl-prolyl cis-trans isomerase